MDSVEYNVVTTEKTFNHTPKLDFGASYGGRSGRMHFV